MARVAQHQKVLKSLQLHTADELENICLEDYDLLITLGWSDEVATVAFTCLQSSSSIARLGARPVWIDIDPATMSMSLEDLSNKLTSSIKAVIVYHVAGYPSDVRRIAELCRDLGVSLIEDCNNAIGATFDDCPVGVVGDYAVYSFYPNRQVNGINAGMLATPNEATQARVIRLHYFGIDVQSFRDLRGEINIGSDISEIGLSSTPNNLNAAVALSQLNTLSERTSRTKANTIRLTSELGGLSRLRLVQTISSATSAYWGFLVLSEHRDALLMYLKDHGIKSSILHQRNDVYTGFGIPPAELPGTKLVLNELLAIPCGWWLSEAQLTELICKVTEFDIVAF